MGSNYLARAENEKYRLTIYQYEDAENPRDFSTPLGTMVCWHRKYDIGDSNKYENPREFLEDLASLWVEETEDNGSVEEMKNHELLTIIKDHCVILPVYMLDHGSVHYSTQDFNDRWDSGQVGWIYIKHEDVEREIGVGKLDVAANCLKGEIDEYNKWASGGAWGFILEEKKVCDQGETHYNTVESVWGFYDEDYATVIEHIGGEYESLVKELA